MHLLTLCFLFSKAMNDLVDLVNNKIKAVVAAAGPQVVFVDWQGDMDAIKGRYCEPGVNETWKDGHGVSEDREETVFYEWGTTKDDDDSDEKGHDELKKRQDITSTPNSPAANATFEGMCYPFLCFGALMIQAKRTGLQARLPTIS